METRVSAFIKEKSLLSHDGCLYLVALSGGADSVCMLLMLHKLGYRIEAVHCNFHLRGEESDRDENFCRLLCRREGVPFHIVHFDTKAYAELHHVSIEMAARELRYAYFERLRHDIGADGICVAHHRDDTVETLLMNLVRGTGIHGLQGIKPKNGNILRPLLCLSRQDIENWLDSINQEYVTDSTNLEDDVVRNKLRLNVIPLLAGINPNVSENISKTALRMVEAGKVFDSAINADVERVMTYERVGDKNLCVVNLEALSSCLSPEYVLFTILSPLHFTSSQIEAIAKTDFARVGQKWESTTHMLVTDRGCLMSFTKEMLREVKMRIPESGVYVISESDRCVEKISLKTVAVDSSFLISKERNCVCLDADKVKFPLTLRTVEKGDRFVPFGMRGSKLISDYLTDKKKNYVEKQLQMTLVDADENVVWLVNERPDARVCVSKNTINSVIVRYYIE